MEAATSFWQTIGQAGIAVLILFWAVNQLWKRYSTSTDERLKSMSAAIDKLQSEKDDLQTHFNERLKEVHDKLIDFVKDSQNKYEALAKEQNETIKNNTSVLRELQQILKKNNA